MSWSPSSSCQSKGMIEVGLHVDSALIDGRVQRELELLALHEHRCVAQPFQPAGVVEVQMRLDHEVDVARLHPDLARRLSTWSSAVIWTWNDAAASPSRDSGSVRIAG